MKPTNRWIASRSDHQTPLLEAVARQLKISRKQAKRLLDARSVFVNQRRVWMARHLIQYGDQLEVQGAPAQLRPEAVPTRLTILQEHPDWLVINKPAGLLSNGPGSVESMLREQLQNPALEAIHRLDRDTSGCLLFARRPAAVPALIELFENKAIRKIYLALVQGVFPAQVARVDKALEGLEAVTDFRVVDKNERASLVEASPLTGRTHQVRLHARSVGHPLAGDRVYATDAVEDPGLRKLPRQMLHAWKLIWRAEDGATISVEAPWPDDFRRALQSLGLRARV